MKLPKLTRTFPAEFARSEPAVEGGPRKYRVTISSEYPVERWFGLEVLDHSPASIDLSRMRHGIALNVDHEGDQVGIVDNPEVGADRTLRGDMTLSRSPRGQEIAQDIDDGIRKYLSVEYRIRKTEITETPGRPDTYRAIAWEPMGCAIAAVPADPTTQIARTDSPDALEVEIINPAPEARTNKEAIMPDSTPVPAPTSGTEVVIQPGRREAEIVELAVTHGFADRAAEWIRSGKSADQVAGEILSAKRAQPLATPAPKADIDLDRQADEYSFSRAIRAAIDMREGRSASCLEMDVHQQLLRNLPAGVEHHGGVLVPFTQKRTNLTTTGSGTGAELMKTVYGDLVPMLRNRSLAVRMGARLLTGLTGSMTFPKQTTAGTFYWTGENPGADVTLSNLGTGTTSFAPKTGMARQNISRQLIYQNSYEAEQLVRDDLGTICSLGWDAAVFHGAGSSNEPDGLYHLSGVNSYAMGGVPTFAKLINAETEAAIDNAILDNTGWVTNPVMSGVMMRTLVASTAGSTMIWQGNHMDGTMAGYRACSSNQISKTLGGGSEVGMIFGSWSECLIGMWSGGVEILVDPYTLAGEGVVRIIAFLMVDVFIRYPVAFVKVTGATIA